MILVGSQRSGAANLAAHLLNDENEHVTVHEVRGVIANDVTGALREFEAVSRATRCKQYLFSLSLNPPQTETVGTPAFEHAADQIEAKLGLDNQPRVIVFHEKQGRRHAHVVWSRIDGEQMKAINLPFYKQRLMEVSKSLYLEHGWQMPAGLSDPLLKDPLNFTMAEWQQALRSERDPREIKQVFRDTWAQSDSLKALKAGLQSRGFYLAKGDRRGLVAIDHVGEVYSFTRWAGIKTKDLNARCSKAELAALPSVEQTKGKLREALSGKLKDVQRGQREAHTKARDAFKTRVRTLAREHRKVRREMGKRQHQRRVKETETRQAQYRKGLSGVLDWVTGRTARLRESHERAAWLALKRDQAERDGLIERQLDDRQAMRGEHARMLEVQRRARDRLLRDIDSILRLEGRAALAKQRHSQEPEHKVEQYPSFGITRNV